MNGERKIRKAASPWRRFGRGLLLSPWSAAAALEKVVGTKKGEGDFAT